MKKRNIRTITKILFISIVLSSCSAKNSLTLSVTEPAPVYIPSSIKTIGVINRSLPSKKNEKLDKLDQILSIEGKDLDKDGGNKAATGLLDELSNNASFSKVTLINKDDIRSLGLGVFPSALPWRTVEEICSENNVDVLFALSYYDTDASIDYKSVQTEINGPLGIKIPALEHHATFTTLIKTGWRIYDPKSKIIRDEYWANESVSLKGVGINPMKAAGAIMGRKDAVLGLSNKLGHNYALRIIPYKIRVSRYYYVRGTDNFEIGKRRAQTGNWDGAAELWEKELSNPKAKIAGRACYNMAIINEINGDLNKAVEWASKAYTDYEDKLALNYIKILKNRIAKNKQLEEESR